MNNKSRFIVIIGIIWIIGIVMSFVAIIIAAYMKLSPNLSDAASLMDIVACSYLLFSVVATVLFTICSWIIKIKHKLTDFVNKKKSKKQNSSKRISKKINNIDVINKYIGDLRKYALKRFYPGNVEDFSVQKDMFSIIQKIFPIYDLMLGTDVGYALDTGDLKDMSITQLTAKIAVGVDTWLKEALNESKMRDDISNTDTETLIKCFMVLDFYCFILKPEYTEGLCKYRFIIASTIYNRGFQVSDYEAETNVVDFSDGKNTIDSENINKCNKENTPSKSYIKECKARTVGPWTEYRFVLDTMTYGWKYCVDELQYLADNDLENISEVCASFANQGENIVDLFHSAGNDLNKIEKLKSEHNSLSIAGFSLLLGVPVKIVLYNQTNVVTIFTVTNNENLIKAYFETIIRRNIGNENKMKLGNSKNSAQTEKENADSLRSLG